jgi:hypothetical protein
VKDQLHAPAAILPEQETAVPVAEGKVWEDSSSGMSVEGEMKNLSYWESNLDSSAVNPVA